MNGREKIKEAFDRLARATHGVHGSALIIAAGADLRNLAEIYHARIETINQCFGDGDREAFMKRYADLEQRNKILEESKTTQVMLDDVKKLFQEALDQRDEAEQKIYEFKRAAHRLMSGRTYG